MTIVKAQWVRFNRWLLLLCLGIFVVVIGLNLTVDPYNVFGTGQWGNGYTDNERFNKVERLLKQPSRFNAFVVGSSRMGLYNPRDVERHRPNHRYYNLAVFGGSSKDAHLMLEGLTGNGVMVEEVIMGIDIFPFLEQDKEITPAYRHHPIVSGQSYFEFYKAYLFVPSVWHMFLKLQQRQMETPDIVFDFEQTGRFYLVGWDERIAANHEKYLTETFKGLSLEQPPGREAVWNEKRFIELSRFRDWLFEEGIRAHFYIHPHHQTELENFTDGSIQAFRKRVEEIVGEIPDYSEYRDWSTNDRWYYEPKHYRPVLAAELLKELFQEEEQSNQVAFRQSDH